MIHEKTLRQMGLTADQVETLTELLHRETKLREIILSCGISPRAVEKIMRKADAEKIDLSNEQALRETITEQFGDLIIKAR